jgi:hypothetical protein
MSVSGFRLRSRLEAITQAGRIASKLRQSGELA